MYEVFQRLLDERGLTAADVAKSTGIYQSTLSNWKRRKNLLSGRHAQLIADFFGVSVDYLMTGKDSAEYYINPATAAAAQEMFENPELRVLFDAARDASPEDLRIVYNLLLDLKRREEGPDEPA